MLHWSRALQLLLLAVGELRALLLLLPSGAEGSSNVTAETNECGRTARGAVGAGRLGVSGQGLDTLTDAAQHMLALTQVLLLRWPGAVCSAGPPPPRPPPSP